MSVTRESHFKHTVLIILDDSQSHDDKLKVQNVIHISKDDVIPLEEEKTTGQG